ncbi:MAG: hypothetical protein R3C59_09435 [Planctomycetaceae bacterium]
MNPPEPQAPKIGQTHAPAMVRLGLKELSQVIAAFPESVQPVEEMGLAGNALPQEVFEARHEKEPNIDQNIDMQM